VSAGVAPFAASAAVAKPKDPPDDWAAFDRAVGSAFDRMELVGGAVAVVSASQVLHTATFGVRSLQGRQRVTTNTCFSVGSTTKSMTAALVATYVDDGTIGWDQRCLDVWSGFRAPTDAMTRALRVRDLLGMASGLGEPANTSLRFGGPTALELLQSVVNLPVVANHVDQQFVYNNTVNAVGAYLPLLATGVAPGDLAAAYGQAMHDRVFGPAGMTTARIASDPRGVVDDFATGNGFDLRPRPTTMPFGPMGSHAPAGGASAGVNDMAAWVRLQLRQGQSVTGHRVVSGASLAECWRPHVTTPLAPDLDPDAVKGGYGMGWLRQEYRDGTSLVFHNGAIDGFTSYMGFLPQHDLGLVVLTNMTSGPTGTFWYTYVLNLLLSGRFGLNAGVPDKALAENARWLGVLAGVGKDARPVDLAAVDPYLGFYEGGYSLARQGRDLQLRIGPRVFPLEVMPDGSYVMSGGFMVGAEVRLARERDGTPRVEIVGAEIVRRTVG
jgi:CubicO group peptidase (beta-lactamase class C family)